MRTTADTEAAASHTYIGVVRSPSAGSSIVSSVPSASSSHFSWDMDENDFLSQASTPSQADAIHGARKTRDPTLTPHEKHYTTKGMVSIRIEDTLFCTPRFGLAGYSETFKQILSDYDKKLDGTDCDKIEPLFISDEDVKSADFARLLDLIYPSEYGKILLTSQDEWLSILHLATKWDFDCLRALSIERLGLLSLVSPIDRLILGRKYNVPEWISGAYFSLCQRADCLTLDESRKIALEDVVKISEGRLKVRKFTGMRPLPEVQSTIKELLRTSTSNSDHVSFDEEMSASYPVAANAPLTVVALPDGSSTTDVHNGTPSLDSPDMARIERLVNLLAKTYSMVTEAAILALVGSYHNQPDVMSSVLQIVATKAMEIEDKTHNFRRLLVSLCGAVHPNCGDESSESNGLRGSAWLANCFGEHCFKDINLSLFSRENTEATLKIRKALTVILSVIDFDGLGSFPDTALRPCWLQIVGLHETSPNRWISPLEHLFKEFGKRIQTAGNALYADQFFHRMEVYLEQTSSSEYQHYDRIARLVSKRA